jgi:hypothetical protein
MITMIGRIRMREVGLLYTGAGDVFTSVNTGTDLSWRQLHSKCAFFLCKEGYV